MNIRNRLTLRFFIIVAVIITLASAAIYFFSADYREENFYSRLRSKANNTAKLLIEVEEVDTILLRKIELDNPVSLPNEKIVIYDFRNKVIFSTDEERVINVDKSLLDRIRLDGEVRYRQNEYEVLGFLYIDRYDRFVVVAAATDIYGFKKLGNLRTILLAVFGISVVVVSFSGWFFAGKALQPISKVVKQVDEITITSLNLRVDEGREEDEIALLARTFNNMLTRLEASFHLQKNFIANASHELRTPLTAIMGQLEVTLLNTRSQDEYMQVIRSVLEDIRSLKDLSNRLLLLAQASTEVNRKMVPLRLDEIIWQAKEELTKTNPAYVINIDMDEKLDDEEKLTVYGDEQLIKTAILNLMDNGCKYSSNHTTDVFVTTFDNTINLIFKDKGVGLSPADLPNIFEPFYRGTNTQHIKGHGIGLSMVERILKVHGGVISVDSVENKGTTFTVSLPLHTL